MRALIALGVLCLSVSTVFTGSAFADNGDQDHPPTCPHCTPETKPACFNVVCHYEMEYESAYHKCTAATKFTKAITLDGGEVVDNSNGENNPTLEVSCDGHVIYNNNARRFTDMLGTRIQGESGPVPAILLPRGELHTGADGQGGGHYSSSVIELDDPSGFTRGKGKCFIWTGFPLE
jgi:hypothetical protein